MVEKKALLHNTSLQFGIEINCQNIYKNLEVASFWHGYMCKFGYASLSTSNHLIKYEIYDLPFWRDISKVVMVFEQLLKSKSKSARAEFNVQTLSGIR